MYFFCSKPLDSFNMFSESTEHMCFDYRSIFSVELDFPLGTMEDLPHLALVVKGLR